MAVKWRFFRHLRLGGDEDAERVYRWHLFKRSGTRMKAGLATDVWKRGLDDYVTAAQGLLASMKANGFLQKYAVPIDPDGELLNGSHRVACALALGIPSIPVIRQVSYCWAPQWDYDWFLRNGMPARDLERLDEDWRELVGGRS